MSNQQITPMQQLSQTMSALTPKLKEVLPPGISPERFTKIATNAIQTHQSKKQLMEADRNSLFLAVQKCASDGLILDGREAALVVFKGMVTYMPMYQGLMKKARNSGEIANIMTEVVYSKDTFSYSPGIDKEPIFKPDWFDDRGEAVGVYCVVTLKSDEKIVSIMTKKRVLDIGNGGRNGHQYDPVKGIHFAEWWKKTAIKNALKNAPSSSDLVGILDDDNKQEFENEWEQDNQAQPQEKPKTKPKKKTKAESIIEADFEESQEPASESIQPNNEDVQPAFEV